MSLLSNRYIELFFVVFIAQYNGEDLGHNFYTGTQNGM